MTHIEWEEIKAFVTCSTSLARRIHHPTRNEKRLRDAIVLQNDAIMGLVNEVHERAFFRDETPDVEDLLDFNVKATEGLDWSVYDPADGCCGSPCTPNGCHESHPQGDICVSGPLMDDNAQLRFENEEHARLVAAAPDLLAALLPIVKGVIIDGEAFELRLDSRSFVAARAAIIKALKVMPFID